MFRQIAQLVALAVATIPRASAAGPTDSYTDADIGQGGYLPNHNMDPAVVDSTEFGLLWSTKNNPLEQVWSAAPTPQYKYSSLVSSSTPNHSFTPPMLEGRKSSLLHRHRTTFEQWTLKPVRHSMVDRSTNLSYKQKSDAMVCDHWDFYDKSLLKKHQTFQIPSA